MKNVFTSLRNLLLPKPLGLHIKYNNTFSPYLLPLNLTSSFKNSYTGDNQVKTVKLSSENENIKK